MKPDGANESTIAVMTALADSKHYLTNELMTCGVCLNTNLLHEQPVLRLQTLYAPESLLATERVHHQAGIVRKAVCTISRELEATLELQTYKGSRLARKAHAGSMPQYVRGVRKPVANWRTGHIRFRRESLGPIVEIACESLIVPGRDLVIIQLL